MRLRNTIIPGFHLIADETIKHVQATGDSRAREMWHEIGSELLERGFTLEKHQVRGK